MDPNQQQQQMGMGGGDPQMQQGGGGNMGMGGGNMMGGGNNAAAAGGQQNAQQGEDYGDKGLDFIEKKTGHVMNRNTNEKITDGARGLFEKVTGKQVDPKYSN